MYETCQANEPPGGLSEDYPTAVIREPIREVHDTSLLANLYVDDLRPKTHCDSTMKASFVNPSRFNHFVFSDACRTPTIKTADLHYILQVRVQQYGSQDPHHSYL